MIHEAWTMIAGASKYVSSLAIGDRASEAVASQRAETCAACPSVKRYSLPIVGQYATCGDQFIETRRTCGCLVATFDEGVVMAAGKVCVGSERCPQGKW